MQSQGELSGLLSKEGIKRTAKTKWNSLSDQQKKLAKKAWGVITYKWRWQIAMNIPYLAVFLLDKTIPAVHEFDMALLSTIASKLPLPSFLASWMGLG